MSRLNAPESTPFVTPVKDEKGFRFPAPLQAVPGACSSSKTLRIDHGPSRSPFNAAAAAAAAAASSKEPSSAAPVPIGLVTSRRDSIFDTKLLSKLNQVNADREVKTAPPVAKEAAAATNAKVDRKKEAAAESPAAEARRPSPVRFTSERPEQFPLRPEPERPTKATATEGPKILSLENLDKFLVKDGMTDFGKEEVQTMWLL